MENVIINWSDPIEIFKPGIYNTDEKFIEHFRKFIQESSQKFLQQTGIYMLLSGEIKPQEKLSVVVIEGTDHHSIKEHILKKKGHLRELKCLYKNYKDETLYIKVGMLENIDQNEENIKKAVCALIEYASPSCTQPCKNDTGISILIENKGNFSPLKQTYGIEE